MRFFLKKLPFRNRFSLTKRGKFVAAVFVLSCAMFFSELFTGSFLILVLSFFLGLITVLFLYLILRQDLSRKSYYFPIFILPFFYAVSFSLFYSLVPSRFLTRLLLTIVFAFGAYSLFLTQNIFTISSLRTINLLRSARIVSFVITIFVLFFLFNIVFSLRLPFFITPLIIGLLSGLMSTQFLWSYTESKEGSREVFIFSGSIAFMMIELSYVLSLWPVTAAIYAIFLTGMFYTYSGLSHAWIEKRLFKGILWEYVWVGLLAIVFLLFFAQWGA